MLCRKPIYASPCSKLLDAAICCAIDAEWPPEETMAEQAQRGSPPHATLVQLALWLPPGMGSTAAASANGSSGATGANGSNFGGSCCVLLLDMLRLPQAAAKATLQAVFRCAQHAWHAACCLPSLCVVCLDPAGPCALRFMWNHRLGVPSACLHITQCSATARQCLQQQGLPEGGLRAGA